MLLKRGDGETDCDGGLACGHVPAVELGFTSIASMTLKDIPEDLHAQLKQVASANFRSVDQEALARLQRSFDLEAAQNTERDQRWVDEALASGPETPLTRAEMDAVRDQILGRKG